MKAREIKLTAIISGSIEENLKAFGYSTSVCVALRKRLGLVYIAKNSTVDYKSTEKTEKYSSGNERLNNADKKTENAIVEDKIIIKTEKYSSGNERLNRADKKTENAKVEDKIIIKTEKYSSGNERVGDNVESLEDMKIEGIMKEMRIDEKMQENLKSDEKGLKNEKNTANIVQISQNSGLLIKEYDEKTPLKLVDNIKMGQNFWIVLEDEITREIPPSETEVKIVYEDDDYVIIDKQSGLAVIANHQHYGKSLENALAKIWGSDFVYRPINRLDKDTSGLMVVAKNQLAHSLLSPEKITRRYLALVAGQMKESGIIDAPLGRQSEEDIKREVCENGKMAITHFKTKKRYEEYSLVEFELQTGRTHQIRAHCAYVGNPLCCDKLYNVDSRPIVCPNGKILDRQALHSYYVAFENPITKRRVELISLPEFVENLEK